MTSKTINEIVQKFYDAVFPPKDADGKENSSDPDQTAPEEQSDLDPGCLLRPIYSNT